MKYTEGMKIAYETAAEDETGTITHVDGGDITVMSATGVEKTIFIDEIQTVLEKNAPVVTVTAPKSSQDHRRDAKKATYSATRILAGKSGLTDQQKAVRICKARQRLQAARDALGDALLAMQQEGKVLDFNDENMEAALEVKNGC